MINKSIEMNVKYFWIFQIKLLNFHLIGPPLNPPSREITFPLPFCASVFPESREKWARETSFIIRSKFWRFTNYHFIGPPENPPWISNFLSWLLLPLIVPYYLLNVICYASLKIKSKSWSPGVFHEFLSSGIAISYL